MHPHPDPAEPPEGLETRPQPSALPEDTDRPGWLVGAEDVLESSPKPSEGPQRPTVAQAPRAPSRQAGADDDLESPERPEGPQRPTVADVPRAPSMRVVEGRKTEQPSKGWSGAASSVPKLSVVSAPDRPSERDEDDDDAGAEPATDADLPLADRDEPSAPAPSGPSFRPLEEPWYLVWAEALATNRKLQIGVAALVVALGAYTLWPKGGAQGTSLSGILNHPERFEGHTVAVRGEVMEIFEVGQGYAFQLRQGRNMVVVYSMTREPRLHDRVEVRGTVSTGYLDGKPRVAIFEGGAP